jgi:hypothetical protein
VERWESPVERAIREAQERGEFDNLPGAGKPLRSLGSLDTDDPDWWVKGLVQREQLDLTGAMPPAIALRKERATFPESLLDLRTEEGVRAVLEDFNRRVRLDRLRPTVGPLPPILAPTVDVAGRWRGGGSCAWPPKRRRGLPPEPRGKAGRAMGRALGRQVPGPGPAGCVASWGAGGPEHAPRAARCSTSSVAG